MPKLKWWQWALIGAVCLGIVRAIAPPPSPPSKGMAEQPGARTSTITTDYVESGFGDAARHALREGRRRRPQTAVTVQVKTTDKYGNTGEGPLLTLTWAETDLSRVNWREIDDNRLLDLAQVTPDSVDAMLAFSDWCWKEGNYGSTLTPKLCRSDGVVGAAQTLSGR